MMLEASIFYDKDLFFSVVIHLYNKEKYIKRAIDSVLEQYFDNFEHSGF